MVNIVMADQFEFTGAFEVLYRHLDDLLGIAQDMLLNIADVDSGDREFVVRYAKGLLATIDKLEKYKVVAGRLQERMEEIRDLDLGLSGGSEERFARENGLRKIEVEVTEGMLRQSILSMTQAKKAKVVSVGEEFTIRLTDGQQFTTELIEPGNKFRERGRIRSIYEAHRVEPGDRIVLEEVEKGIWGIQVKRAKAALEEKFLEMMGSLGSTQKTNTDKMENHENSKNS